MKNMKNMKLICKLKKHVISENHDFVPQGTPVSVIGWSDNHRCLLVRPVAHVFDGSLGETHLGPIPVVGDGLYIFVKPEELVYKDSFRTQE